ncbi:MAG TPA: TolC family protein [Chitinophaga sp.]|uniref:TolC family protein n=1 Tax=Chitinophaga sp. TaxID=1869181 RepID=UPI002CA740D2|nr:TolC family protein [Chitinophaga sp.]HVI47053.1 TolC family protein [Chitinophaga sp.]
MTTYTSEKWNNKVNKRLFRWLIITVCSLDLSASFAQQKTLGLAETVRLAVDNSHTLSLLQARIREAASRYKQANDDLLLPNATASAAVSHAETPAHHIILGSLDLLMPERSESYTGKVAISKTIYSGSKLQYATRTAALMQDLSRLDLEKNRDAVILTAIELYGELYKVTKELEVAIRHSKSADSLVAQAEAFWETGIVTKNDVLRFRLRRSEIGINITDLQANYNIINYQLLVLLNLPESIRITPQQILPELPVATDLSRYIQDALQQRPELQQVNVQTTIDSLAVRSIRAETLPRLDINTGVNYFHAGSAFIPASGSYLAQFSIGAGISWNFSSLWFNKNNLSTAKIRYQQNSIEKSIRTDVIRTEVNTSYQRYLQGLSKIQLLEDAIREATENNRMQEERYRNNVVTVIERIDADTQLYQSLASLEVARAESGVAWYRLLKATGKLFR